MLLIQHCALKNRFEDKWPLGWAARRGPVPPAPLRPGRPSKDVASGRLWPGPEGGESAEQAAQGQPVQIRRLNPQPPLQADGKPGNWLKGTRPNKACLPTSILGFPSSMARGDARHRSEPSG